MLRFVTAALFFAAAMALIAGPQRAAFAADYAEVDDGVERVYDERDVAIALHEQGFVSWDDIDWDDGVWEVDDARRADGREYDLKLDSVTLAVIQSDRD